MKSFTKNDDAFACRHCGAQVSKLSYTSRNHCPRCLHSLHVDVNPGDRANPCGGPMRPIGVEMNARKGTVIVFQCQKCGEIRRNKSAKDDDFNRILKLSAHEPLE